ncbi:lysophospholipid acyltransferase family protein [Phormidesmis priestleyi]
MLSIRSLLSPSFSARRLIREVSQKPVLDRQPAPATNLSEIADRQFDESPLTDGKTEDTANKALYSQTINRANLVGSRFSPWLALVAYPLGRYGLLPVYFRHIEVIGRENLPKAGPVILAPTHRSRWDAFMVPCAAGQDVTGRELRFMVSADEVKGIQGWFIRRLGGFEIDTKHPAISSLRHSVELLKQGEVLVIFPEGNIFRECRPLKPGLARLALQAEASHENLGIQIVPINIHYSQPLVPWRCSVEIRIGSPLKVSSYDVQAPKQGARKLTADLENALKVLDQATIEKSDRY